MFPYSSYIVSTIMEKGIKTRTITFVPQGFCEMYKWR